VENQSWKKLRKNDGGHFKGRCWNCLGERMLLVVDALLIGKKMLRIIQKGFGSCRGNMGKNLRKKRLHTIKSITIEK